MTIRVCDRCNKRIPSEKEPVLIKVNEKYNNKEYELCDMCTVGLRQYLNNKHEEG